MSVKLPGGSAAVPPGTRGVARSACWWSGDTGGAVARVRVDGKRFACGGERLRFRGVTYGTFRPREADGALFPEPDQVKRDLMAIREHGFTVVRTYTPPPDDVLDLAAELDLRLLVDVFYPDGRYLLGWSPGEWRAMERHARATVRREARRLADHDQVLALVVGNELPADVVRWRGTSRVAGMIADLADAVRQEDPDRLVTYGNYPTAEYLPLDALDFLTFNVFLERRTPLRRYLTRLHHLAGDRPVVLGEIGLDAGGGPEGERRQAEALDWMLATTVERGVAGACVFSWTDEWWVGGEPVQGWHFGLTRGDRSPRPALDVARRWNHRDVADLDVDWPSLSVVVCAYNAQATLAECLEQTGRLDYPDLKIIVVDDGSTDATPAIAARHPGVRLVRVVHGGLGAARNVGYEVARGEVVAYLDADAYPAPEWPYYLALGFDAPLVGGVGGPNVPPDGDPPGAHAVARCPGGPVHVLLSDSRAEHVPGCNMAFWRKVLVELGGFDPIYEAAGDDVDLCWRLLDAGWDIGFHPAALVWHHRRPDPAAYLRQQRGYGRAEALVEARHPDRFTSLGTARWRGRIYDHLTPLLGARRVYRGPFGTAAYQSVYGSGGHLNDLLHQVGVPGAFLALLTAPLALVSPWLGLPAAVALTALALLGGADAVAARPPPGLTRGRGGFRATVAALHLTQPLARLWGRLRHGRSARRELTGDPRLPGPVQRLAGGVLLLPAVRPRARLAAEVVRAVRRAGLRVRVGTGWEDHDAEVCGSLVLAGGLVTSAHPSGCCQVRVRPRPRWRRLGVAGILAAALMQAGMAAAALLLVLAVLADLVWGAARLGPGVRRAVLAAAGGDGRRRASAPVRGGQLRRADGRGGGA